MTAKEFDSLARKINANGQEIFSGMFSTSKVYKNMVLTLQDGGYTQSILIKDVALYKRNWYGMIFTYPVIAENRT